MGNVFGLSSDIVVSLLALIFGVLILIAPKLLNYLVAIYLIIVGVVGLWPHVMGAAPPA